VDVVNQRDKLAAEKSKLTVEKERAVTERDKAVAERDKLAAEKDKAIKDSTALQKKLKDSEGKFKELRDSVSNFCKYYLMALGSVYLTSSVVEPLQYSRVCSFTHILAEGLMFNSQTDLQTQASIVSKRV